MTEAGSRQHTHGKLAGGEREWGGKHLGRWREGDGKDEIPLDFCARSSRASQSVREKCARR